MAAFLVKYSIAHPYLRTLIGLLGSEDPVVLAVAVHDLGQYVKHYERGKK
jgi:V-type H+-transporting ATPase subunit H